MGNQLQLAFDRGLPVPIRPTAVRRAALRNLRAIQAGWSNSATDALELCKAVALLEEVRARVREEARKLKRQAHARGTRLRGLAAIAYVCTPEGRRAQRLIDRLSERIAEQERRLCA